MSSNRNRIGPGLDKKNKTACASLSCRVVCQDWFWRAALLFFIFTREGGHSAPLSVSSALTQTDRNIGEGGKERKGSAEARSAQNPASEHKPLNRIFKKGFFVIWWRRWMTECFFKMSFMGNIQMFSHLRSSDTKCSFVTQLTQGSRSHLCTHRLTNPAHAIQAALLLLLLLLLGLVINNLPSQRFCGYMSCN